MMEEIREKILSPSWRAIKRLFAPEVRIVTGGIAFYALFSIFPMISLLLTFMGVFLPVGIAARLAPPISDILSQGLEPLSAEEITMIGDLTPQGLTFRALFAIVLVLFTAISGAKAAITGIRMIAGSVKQLGVFTFNGVSLLMTAVLILAVWVLGATQLIMAAAMKENGALSLRLVGDVATLVDTLWVSKWIGSFVVFYIIIGLSLRGHISGGRAKAAGAAMAALAWLWGYILVPALPTIQCSRHTLRCAGIFDGCFCVGDGFSQLSGAGGGADGGMGAGLERRQCARDLGAY